MGRLLAPRGPQGRVTPQKTATPFGFAAPEAVYSGAEAPAILGGLPRPDKRVDR